jgi:diguanylate cyclase (GGDEF)-like protein/PAS domain S-box-containing protein
MNTRVSQLAVVFVTFIGCSVLLGWLLDISLLKIGFPGNIYAMKVNTSLCFFLTGISLGLLQHQQLSWWLIFLAQACALLTETICLLTLSESFFGWNLGIDELLFPHGIPTMIFPYQTGMGEITAFNFVLLGIALLLLLKKTRYCDWLAQSLSCLVALIATLALVDDLLNAHIFYQVIISTKITSSYTSVALIVLSVGILLTYPDKGFMGIVTSASIGGIIARRLLPWALLVPIAINWLMIWGLDIKNYDHTFIHALQTITIIAIFSILILANAQSINQVEAHRQRAEQRLRESEQQFRCALMYSPLPIMIHAEDGEVLQINHTWTDITGYKPEDISTIAEWTERAYGERQESIQEVIDSVYKLNNRVAEGEFTVCIHNGERRIWEFYSAPLGKDPMGRRLVISTAIDITNRKQAEDALVQINSTLEMRVKERTAELIKTNQQLQHELHKRQQVTQALEESERRFRAIFEQTFQFIGLLTPDGTVLELNQRPLEFIRARREDVINKPFWELSCWSCTVEIQENLKAAIAQAAAGQFIRTEVTLPDADGVMTDFDFSLKPVRDESGQVVLLIPEGRDISNFKRTQSQLRSVSDRLKYLLTASPAVIFSCKPDGDYGATFISDNVTAILGYQPQDFLENSDFWVSHVHPEDVEQTLRSVLQIFETNYHSHQYRFLRADGTYCWLETHMKLVRDHNDNPVEFVGYLTDIDQRKATEAALRESEERFQAFMNYSPTSSWITDADGTMLYASPTYLRTFKLATNHFIGKTLFDLFPKKFAQPWVEKIKKVAADHQVMEAIESAPRRDNTMGDFLVYEFPIEGLSGQQLVGGVAVDITEYRQATLALAEREILLRSIGDNLPHGAIYQGARELDGSYCFYYMSAGIENICEIKPEDILRDINCFHHLFLEEDFQKLLPAIDESFRNLSVFNIQLRIRTPTGKIKWLNFRSTPRSLNDGRIVWDGIVIDVTDIKQAEEALQLQAEKEKALNRVIQTIRNSLDLQTIFNTAAAEAAKLLQVDRVEIVQYIPSQKLWKHVAEYLQTSNLVSFLGMDIPDEGNKIAEQIKKLEVVRINDTTTTMDDQINSKFAQLFPGALLMVPIQIDSTLWGSLTLGKSKQHCTWQDAEVELSMKVAEQLMIAIQQSELYQQLQIANQELQRLATLDGLTQLANRRRFDEYLKQEWLRLIREQNPLSLVLCDVDYFKRYNDTYGHPAGDVCLMQIAQAISRAVRRPADLVARYGGEEFAVLLPNTNTNGALQVVRFVQKKIRQINLQHTTSPIGKHITLSFGIATTFPSHDSSAQALVNAADRALYQAKENGRNCYQSISLEE